MSATTILLNDCVPQCPELYFSDSISRCHPCNQQCNISCFGPLNTQCGECLHVSYNSACLSSCPPGTFEDSNHACQACNAQCRSTCTGPTSSDCNACLNFNNTINNECVQQCPLGTYTNTQAQCMPCDFECLDACIGPGPTQCYASCTGGSGCLPPCKHALLVTPQSHLCVAECPADTYLDLYGQCQQCDSQCSGCTGPGPSACLGCLYFSYEGTCYKQCPIGTFPSVNYSCSPCHAECSSQGCYGPGPTNCISCLHVNNSGACQYSCPGFTFLENNNNCLSCNSECATGCKGPLPSQCDNGACVHVSFQSDCLASCPIGTLTLGSVCQPCPYGNYYLNSTTGNCSLCSTECTNGCTGPTASDCIGPCKNVFIVQPDNTTTCLPSCPPMTYESFDRQCRHCSSMCSQGCSGPGPSLCSACKYHMYGGQCIQTCPPGTHGADGIDCTLCDVECHLCYGDGPLACTSCVHAQDPVLGCVASCPLSKWTISQNNITLCVPCNTVPALALDNNICRVGCPLGKYSDINGVCQLCDSQCSVSAGCSGPGPSNCISCATAKLGTICVSNCPTNMYMDAQHICQNCSEQCMPTSGCVGPLSTDCVECAVYQYPANAPLGPACKSGQSCARCLSICPGVLDHGLCTTSCGSFEYVGKNFTCQSCDSLCATGCVGGGPSACQGGICSSNKLLNGTCVAGCPPFTVSISGICQACNAQCASGCTGLGASDCLNGLCTNSVFNGVCVAQCPLGMYSTGNPGAICQGRKEEFGRLTAYWHSHHNICFILIPSHYTMKINFKVLQCKVQGK